MQKVLVSAGAVGAAALELNNNQATEVVEAAPHGVQQRRRSQTKKEEPAALIKRGHTSAKAHHGNSAARVQNGATVFWIVFGIIGILGLALGLGLGLGLPGDLNCKDLSKANDKPCAAGNVVLTNKADYDTFVETKCTKITGNLILDALIVATGSNAVEKVQFKDLIEVTGTIRMDRLGATQTTEKIVFDRLVKAGANIDILGTAVGTGDAAFVEFKTPCLKEVVGNLQALRSCAVKNTDFGNLEKANKVIFDDFGVKTSATYRFGKLKTVDEIEVISTKSGNKQNYHFTQDGLEVATKVRMIFGQQTGNTCANDILGFRFPSTDKFFADLAEFEYVKAGATTGTMRFGSSSSVPTLAANWPTAIKAPGGGNAQPPAEANPCV